MNNIIAVKTDWKPDPFPGSDEAIDAGCTCPLYQPSGELKFAEGCKVHELERAPN